jgi:hypothetical protein
MDEDDIDDFLDSNGDSENDGSKSHHHFDIINRNTSKTKRSAKSRPTVKKENTNDTFEFVSHLRYSGSTKKSVKRHATPSAPSKYDFCSILDVQTSSCQGRTRREG